MSLILLLVSAYVEQREIVIRKKKAVMNKEKRAFHLTVVLSQNQSEGLFFYGRIYKVIKLR